MIREILNRLDSLQDNLMKVLEFDTNPFGGVITNPAHLPDTAAEFEVLLTDSLEAWGRDGFKVVWLETPIEKAEIIPVAVNHGFTFHHSEEDYLMMTCRLVAGAYVPPYATHYTGAGGVVINEKNELLVVSEKYRRSTGNPSYKLPRGDRSRNRIRRSRLLPTLARIPIWQIGHLLRLPAQAPERGSDNPGGRDLRRIVDAR